MEPTVNLASSAQLEIIDKLRELGISDFVALPQASIVFKAIVEAKTNYKNWIACCGRRSVEASCIITKHSFLTLSVARAPYSRASLGYLSPVTVVSAPDSRRRSSFGVL